MLRGRRRNALRPCSMFVQLLWSPIPGFPQCTWTWRVHMPRLKPQQASWHLLTCKAHHLYTSSTASTTEK